MDFGRVNREGKNIGRWQKPCDETRENLGGRGRGGWVSWDRMPFLMGGGEMQWKTEHAEA